jgi:prepilin-type N-terminal cleavage/methylation domain-containing protein
MKRNKKGFTLVELMVCMLIIGILGCGIMPVMDILKKKAYITEAIIAMNRIRLAEIQFYLENGHYASESFLFNDPYTGNPSAIKKDLENIITDKELNGTFFGQWSYGVFTDYPHAGLNIYVAPDSVDNYTGQAVKSSDVNRILNPRNIMWATGYIRMDMQGNVSSTIPETGLPQDK